MSDLRISWSRLRSHRECHQRGYLQRAGKGAVLENQRGFFPGTVTDRVVRDWLADDPYSNPGVMPDMVEAIIEREQKRVEEEEGKQLRWKDAGDRDAVLRECQKAVTLIEPSLNNLVLPFDYDVDFGFKAPIQAPHPAGHSETVVLNGFMDIIVRRAPDQWAVYDVKHTIDNQYWKKTRGQLSFYDLAVDVMFEAPTFEVGLLQPLCNERERIFHLSEEDRTILLSHVLEMATDVWTENFDPNAPASACSFCNVKHACSRFSPVNGRGRISLI